ncbi:MAG: hypothetical protein ABSF29_07995, partial [Tepidisphaeraceae bacterium]
MLTVLAIIIIILATAVPVWNTLTGNHSIAAAQNQVAAALATARTDAINSHQVTGIFFFIDPATQSVALAEVQADPQSTGGTTFTPTQICDGLNNSPTQYSKFNNGPLTALELVNYYTAPPTETNGPTIGTFTYYRDVVILSPNVGIALYNNYYGYSFNTTTLNNGYQPFDRYSRLGAILFDANGQLISLPFGVQQTRVTPYYTVNTATTPTLIQVASQLGRRLGLLAP